jgi:hypothetical protein
MDMKDLNQRVSSLPRLGLAAAALLLSAAGCTVTTSNDGVVAPAGRLVMQWTIEGSTNPSLCSATGADTFDIIVVDSAGEQVGEWAAPCSAFSTTISVLEPGRYSANAVLMSGNAERTTQVPINPFTITSSDLVIPVDFPADSFL